MSTFQIIVGLTVADGVSDEEVADALFDALVNDNDEPLAEMLISVNSTVPLREGR